MKREMTAINYPIAKESTTVQNIFRTLGVISNAELKTAAQRGKILVDGVPCDSIKSRVAGGQVLTYSEFEISVHIDETAKGQRLLTELMKTGGFRGNSNGITNGSGMFVRR